MEHGVPPCLQLSGRQFPMFHMFRAGMKYKIGGEMHCTKIVTPQCPSVKKEKHQVHEEGNEST